MLPYETLADYRRRVAELYAAARREEEEPEARWRAWRRGRETLFLEHPQSPLDAGQKARFTGLPTYDYDPAYRFLIEVEPTGPAALEIELPEGVARLERFGRIAFEVGGEMHRLALYWLLGYGGGLFLPFRDLTSGDGSYGGGRYVLDTIKHADLGHEGGRLVVDFNFAYNPSCAYNPRWVCPLAPAENRLDAAIRAGEKAYPEGELRH